jgi:hypothetical protein
LADLNFSAANIHSVEDKAQNAFEEEPWVEAKLAELRQL